MTARVAMPRIVFEPMLIKRVRPSFPAMKTHLGTYLGLKARTRLVARSFLLIRGERGVSRQAVGLLSGPGLLDIFP
jgi:hypothetical protein